MTSDTTGPSAWTSRGGAVHVGHLGEFLWLTFLGPFVGKPSRCTPQWTLWSKNWVGCLAKGFYHLLVNDWSINGLN